jgi:hypothetical protein
MLQLMFQEPCSCQMQLDFEAFVVYLKMLGANQESGGD